MDTTYQKVDDSTIKVIKTETKETAHNYSFLKKQLVDITAQRDRDNALRDAEIAEVEKLILEAEKLGITETEVVEDIQQ